MADSPASKSAKTKQLKEHLQEKQEPFTLNIFLAERGYLVKCLSSNDRFGCCQIDLFNMKKPRSYNLVNKKMVHFSAKAVKSILYKLISANEDSQQELRCCSNNANQDEFRNAEPNKYSEVGLLTPFGASLSCNVENEFPPSKYNQPDSLSTSFQASDHGGVPEKTLFTDETCQGKCTQDKHLNLMAILNKLSSDKVHHIITRQENPSSRNSTLTEIAKTSFVSATFPWKLLGKSLMERYTLIIGYKEGKGIIKSYSPVSRQNQEFFNQRKLNKLPEKSIKNYDKINIRNNYNYTHWFIGVEKLGNPTRPERIYSCRKFSTNSNMDFSGTLEDWNYTQKLQRKMCFELGDTIMDDIVEEIIYLLL